VTVTSGVVTAITMNASKKFYKYAFALGTSSLTSNWQVSPENGTRYVETDLLMVFNRMDSTKRLEIMALAQSERAVIVVDQNGTMFYLGYEEGVRLIPGSDGQTGTARADRNGYTVVLQDVAGELPMTFTGTVPTT
jgi:MinD-like ATPase involved in chromosome partitioning or flagellar assembly